MASRLEEDDTQGQNKWADIDDDDDDWAPDAITWGDGTKTTLPHPDENLPPPSDSGSVTSRGKLDEKPKSPAPPPGAVGSPLPKSTGLASGKGLVLKSGPQEKPSLVAKPPAPAQAKSPWATLPPVEKSSPAGTPEPTHAPRGHGRELPPVKGSTPPPKEIAADDFSRPSWRDGASHGNRELFNSQSGRYEPVTDRRGSLRADQTRHTALLQRPSGGEHPAEPSSAFQTNRAGPDAPFGRRRGSSNVSGGSGSYMQRLSKGNEGPMPPPEIHGARRASLAGSAHSPVSPANLPASLHGQPRHQPPPSWAPRSSPGANFATPHNAGQPPVSTMGPPPPPVPAQPQEDDVEYQKKLMREKRELAMKRRQEEEAKEEAARKERIRKKLDELGPAPEKKSEKNESSKSASAKPTHIQQREQPAPTVSSTQSIEQAQQSANQRDSSKSNVKSLSPDDGMPPGPASRRLSESQDGKQPDPWAGPGPRSDRFTSWGSAVLPPPSRNVWGSPDNDRGLGNGTFNPDLGRPGSSTAPPNKGPAPIAPPSAARASSQGRPDPPAPPAAIGSRPSRYGAPASNLASKWVSDVADKDKQLSATRAVERVERERQLAERGMSLDEPQPTIKDTWRPVHVPGDGTRRSMPTSMDARSQPPGPWKPTREELGKGSATKDDAVPSAVGPGVIGSGSSSMQASQSRTSRFFPAKDARTDSQPPRPNSPSPPPPTMEGHPVYEGDVMHPHVSLPRPQPVVKLPPALGEAQPRSYQGRPSFGWANPPPFKDSRAVSQPQNAAARTGESSQSNWQNRINNLLNGGKQSPPKAIGVDPASKSALDDVSHRDSATVSLPGIMPVPAGETQRPVVTKPMAEECFEEQEMGSLPQIRIPHKAPDAAWDPAIPTTKPLPKKFIVQASIMEPYAFAAEVVGGGNALRIQFPGMKVPKVVTIPFSATRGGGRGGSHHGRSTPRSRGSSHGSRGAKRDSSSTYENHASTSSGRGGRGGYRSRGSENWSRQPPAQPSLPA